MSLLDQVEDLKQKVRNKIYLKRPAVHNQYEIRKHSDELDNSLEYYEYVEEESGSRLQPILADDERKKSNKGFLRLLKTTEEPDAERQLPVMRRRLANDTGHAELASSTQGAARRNYFSKLPELLDQELWWVHARVLITPFLTGSMSDRLLQGYYTVGMKDHTFLRFMQLLHHNTTGHDISDVRTVLVQISNLKLRLFLWQGEAIKILLNELIDGTQHTFGLLKKGLKRQFKEWRLDTSATEILLKESRMFRPPCINWRPGGSTKHQSRATLTPATPRALRRPCLHEDDESCEEGLREGDAAAPGSGNVEGAAALTTDPRVRGDGIGKTEAASSDTDAKLSVERTVIEWLNQRAGKEEDKAAQRAKMAKRHRHKWRG